MQPEIRLCTAAADLEIRVHPVRRLRRAWACSGKATLGGLGGSR